MLWETVKNSFCPKVWDQWQSDGISWVIQDLLPEDDKKAVQILLQHLCPDETMCVFCGVNEDPVGFKSIGEFWMHSFAKRTSLGCYAEVAGTRTLVGLNVCLVKAAEDEEKLNEELVKGESWQNVYKTLSYVESKFDAMEYLGLDKVLTGMGLVVRREYRGQKLGVRLLEAREPLCRSLGIKGTTTVFTGIASQKTAARSGFTTVLSVSLRELADAGLPYPRDDNRDIKLMVKKYK